MRIFTFIGTTKEFKKYLADQKRVLEAIKKAYLLQQIDLGEDVKHLILKV